MGIGWPVCGGMGWGMVWGRVWGGCGGMGWGMSGVDGGGVGGWSDIEP